MDIAQMQQSTARTMAIGEGLGLRFSARVIQHAIKHDKSLEWALERVMEYAAKVLPREAT